MQRISLEILISVDKYLFIFSYYEDGHFRYEYQALADEHKWWIDEDNKGLKENNAEVIKRHLDIRPTEGLANKSSLISQSTTTNNVEEMNCKLSHHLLIKMGPSPHHGNHKKTNQMAILQ